MCAIGGSGVERLPFGCFSTSAFALFFCAVPISLLPLPPPSPPIFCGKKHRYISVEQLEATFKLQAERGNAQELETVDPEIQGSSATALSIGGEAGHSPLCDTVF